MNWRFTYRLAWVLVASQLRGTRRGSFLKRFFTKPFAILIADALVFAIASLGTWFLIDRVRVASFQKIIAGAALDTLSGLPILLPSSILLLALFYELSQTSSFASSDVVNWLPVTAYEYVVASSSATVYVYSFFVAIGLGFALPVALSISQMPAWLASLTMTVVAMFVAAFAIEIIRALTNRVTSSLYRRSGRSAIAIRLVVTVLALVGFQLAFSSRLLLGALEFVVAGANTLWFIPPSWPSLTVSSVYNAQLSNAAGFAIGSIAYAALVFSFGVEFRRRYWVPVPLTVKLSNGAYAPKTGRLGTLGFNIVEAAIIRKDIRGLIRRREMARFLAIPIIMGISLLIPVIGATSARTPPSAVAFFVIAPSLLVGLGLVSSTISMTSIGQEGPAVWNIYATPLLPKELFKAKALTALFLSSAAVVPIVLILSLVVRLRFELVLAMLALGFFVSIENTLIGLVIGARYPDFREMVRSRFVSVWGSLLGAFLGVVASTITIAPLIVLGFLGSNLGFAFSVTLGVSTALVIASVVSVTSYFLAVSGITKLLESQPS